MKTVFANCNLFDGKANSTLKKCDVAVENGVITEIGNGLVGDKTVDLQGKYLLPGLINMHAHLFGSGKPSKALGGGNAQKRLVAFISTKLGRKILNALVTASVKSELASGVTTVRSVGDFLYSDVLIRDKINAGKLLGPRMIVSGPAITVSGGHGDGTFAMTADTPDGLRALVRKNAEHKVDFIKICVTGGVMDAKKKGEPGEIRMSLEQTAAVTDEAHKLGYKVASHTESNGGVEITVAAQVDTIEHGGAMSEEVAARLKDYGGAIITTYSPALPLAKLPPEVTLLSPMCIYNSEIVFENMTAGAKQCVEKGIAVGMGTDASCPFCTQYNFWREIVYFAKYVGVSNAYALHKATLGHAQILGIDKETGSIEVGKKADMIVVAENPLDDLTRLGNVELVVVNGKRFVPKLKKNAFVDEQLDAMWQKLK